MITEEHIISLNNIRSPSLGYNEKYRYGLEFLS